MAFRGESASLVSGEARKVKTGGLENFHPVLALAAWTALAMWEGLIDLGNAIPPNLERFGGWAVLVYLVVWWTKRQEKKAERQAEALRKLQEEIHLLKELLRSKGKE